jgi:cytochrome c peroxidase
MAAGAALLAGLTNPPPESTRAQFRTPTLRDLVHTAPYMHAGQMTTLEEVVDFYDVGGATPASGTLDPLVVPLALSAEERGDLLAFLRALESDPVPESLRTAP